MDAEGSSTPTPPRFDWSDMKTALICMLLVVGCVRINVKSVEEVRAPARMATAADVWEDVKDSIVNLSVYDGAGAFPVYWGTACYVFMDEANDFIEVTEDVLGRNMYVFLTAKHMVYKDEVLPGHTSKIDMKLSIHAIERGMEGHASKPIEIKENKENSFITMDAGDIDISIVVLLTNRVLELKPIRMIHESRSDQMFVGQKVYSVGCQWMRTPLFKQGMVSKFRFDRLVLDIGVAGGASGGPVLDDQGNMIGVTVARYDDTTAIVVPMNKVYEFFRKVGLGHEMMCRLEETNAKRR